MTAYALTILTPYGSGLARKHIFANGQIRQADKIRKFHHATADVSTPEKLLHVIERISMQNAAVIRGESACGRQPLIRQKAHVTTGGKDRGDEGFVEVPRAWLALDIDGMKLPPLTDWRDGMDPVIEHAIGLLPEAFHDARSVWQLTASHGLEKNAEGRWTGNYVSDTARLRLWFLLDRPIESELAETWTKAMAGPLALDASVSRTVQMNYVARPTTEAGTDPLLQFISRGIPVAGLRDGLEDRVVVPDGIEAEARWARAEGRSIACASHPSADAAIAAIGRPRQDTGRAEIRSHWMAATHHIVRQEWQAKRQPSAAAVAETIRSRILAQKDAIEINLSAHGRSWGEVVNYLDGYHLESYAAWLIERGPSIRGADGGGKRKTVQRIKVATVKDDSAITVLNVDQIMEKTASEVDRFIREDVVGHWAKVSAYWKAVSDLDLTSDLELPTPARRLVAVSTGARKTAAAIKGSLDYIATERPHTMEPHIFSCEKTEKGRAAYLAVPHHKLSAELADRVKAQAAQRGMAVKTVVWRGRKQPDPIQPDQGMCHRLDDVALVESYKLPVGKTLCAAGAKENKVICSLASVCGYMRQTREARDADVVIVTHAALLQLPKTLPDPGLLIVDEAAHQQMIGGVDGSKVSLAAIRKRPTSSTMPDELRWGRVELATMIAQEDDGGIRVEALQALRQSLGAMGLRPGDLAKLEYKAAGQLAQVVVKLSGDDLEAALKRSMGDAAGVKAAHQMGHLWSAIDAASELPAGSRSGRLEIVTTDAENDLREVRIRWKEELAAVWNDVPILFLDATADATVLQACFDRVTPSPRYVAFSPHVRIRQVVDRALSHAAIAPKTEAELKDATPAQKANAVTARNNALKVKARLIEDALSRYGGEPVVAIVPAATEAIWREGPLPNWLSVLHHGAITGLDAYGRVRANYVVGRPLPAASDVERMAGTLTGVAPALKGYQATKRELVQADGSGVIVDAWQHPDPLCEALRRQITEASIIQGAGRGRGLSRDAATPLDIVLWTDVAVPELGFVEAETWQGPSVEAEMLAAGCWIDLPSDAARIHPEVVTSPGALKKARLRMTRDICLYEAIISKCPWSYSYRPATGRRSAIGTAVFLNDVTENEARAWLEARLGPLALLERVQPEASQPPLPAPQEAAGAPVDLSPAPASIEVSPAASEALWAFPPVLEIAPRGDIQPDHEGVDLTSYTGGIMPPGIASQSRALQSALGLTQQAFADLIGVSRSHLANAQAGRYPLSEAAAARLVSLLRTPPPIRQPDLFAAVH